MVHHFIAYRLTKDESMEKSYFDWSLVAAAKFMALLFASNDQSEKLPISEFYNTAVDGLDLVYDYDLWQKNSAPFSFCQYPFLISVGSKISIMEIDAKRQMEKEIHDALISMILDKRVSLPFLVLHIRRDHLISDSLNQVGISVPLAA